jgi:6-hydroxytryprostatin B O-methyltransferase
VNLVPSAGTISFSELATKAKIAPQRLVSTMRYLIHRRIFAEPSPGQLAHSPMSLLLQRPDCHGWVNHYVLEGTKCVSAMPKQYNYFGGEDLSSLHSAVSIAYENYTDSPMAIQASGEERAALFSQGMRWLSTFRPVHDEHLVDGFPWEEFTGATVVDVAGGNGHLSFALARKYPQFRPLIVQDLADQIALAEIPADLAGQVQFLEFDLFQPNPTAADLYILRFILHDFDDDSCVQIIRNLLSAMNDGASILLLEGVLGADHGKSSADRLLGLGIILLLRRLFTNMVNSVLNMSMMTDFNGAERSLEDWEKLFTQADPRLELRRIVSPLGVCFRSWSLGTANEFCIYFKLHTKKIIAITGSSSFCIILKAQPNPEHLSSSEVMSQ